MYRHRCFGVRCVCVMTLASPKVHRIPEVQKVRQISSALLLVNDDHDVRHAFSLRWYASSQLGHDGPLFVSRNTYVPTTKILSNDQPCNPPVTKSTVLDSELTNFIAKPTRFITKTECLWNLERQLAFFAARRLEVVVRSCLNFLASRWNQEQRRAKFWWEAADIDAFTDVSPEAQ